MAITSTTVHVSSIPEPAQATCTGQKGEQAADAASSGSWAAMPQKGQLGLITSARLVEMVASGSQQSFIIFQLRSFAATDGSLPDTATVALQLSLLRAAGAIPQLFTSTLWGMLADHPRIGRRAVIVLGLVLSGIGSFGLGFTHSFAGAVVWRLVVGMAGGKGAAMRSTIREISGERFESRGVLLLPAAFNLGSIIGPVLGGLLADGAVGGTTPTGGWFAACPFLLPNAVNGFLKLGIAALIAFRLKETHPAAGKKSKKKKSISILPLWVRQLYTQYLQKRQARYEPLANQEYELNEQEEGQRLVSVAEEKQQPVSIWTMRLILTLAARALVSMHLFSYPSLLLVFASTPRFAPSHDFISSSDNSSASAVRSASNSTYVEVPPDYHPHGPFVFTGGLAFRPRDIATVFAIRGVVGALLQLIFFPKLRDMFGTLRLYRYALVIFPVAYALHPYLTALPSATFAPLPSSGVALWAVVVAILVVQSTARSMVLPAGAMMLNAACPDRAVLATVNGIGASVGAAARGMGHLVMTGWLYGVGLGAGVVGLAWWAMAGVAVAAVVAAACVPDGLGSGALDNDAE
ncbi:Major facilitator superfamily domain, general substrate transporter [Akanthomyces lecanii RCEF 1005]|uniref:Major facilitator superfamily domain, general substrate transporter n=1 Tax=Akanthomyces lecanii RCEF 1005 TaxID=1081108 RepID=A0A162N3D9_CORDF|nr:Major facilitator superfamily domain, general substrate transporter [Akanthomyces lecanii RCEF 1005]